MAQFQLTDTPVACTFCGQICEPHIASDAYDNFGTQQQTCIVCLGGQSTLLKFVPAVEKDELRDLLKQTNGALQAVENELDQVRQHVAVSETELGRARQELASRIEEAGTTAGVIAELHKQIKTLERGSVTVQWAEKRYSEQMAAQQPKTTRKRETVNA